MRNTSKAELGTVGDYFPGDGVGGVIQQAPGRIRRATLKIKRAHVICRLPSHCHKLLPSPDRQFNDVFVRGRLTFNIVWNARRPKVWFDLAATCAGIAMMPKAKTTQQYDRVCGILAEAITGC